MVLLVFLLAGFGENFAGVTEFGGDWLVVLFIIALCLLAQTSIQGQPDGQKKFRLSLLIAFVAPLTIGIIFKYFLACTNAP